MVLRSLDRPNKRWTAAQRLLQLQPRICCFHRPHQGLLLRAACPLVSSRYARTINCQVSEQSTDKSMPTAKVVEVPWSLLSTPDADLSPYIREVGVLDLFRAAPGAIAGKPWEGRTSGFATGEEHGMHAARGLALFPSLLPLVPACSLPQASHGLPLILRTLPPKLETHMQAYGEDGLGILTVSGVPEYTKLRSRLLKLISSFTVRHQRSLNDGGENSKDGQQKQRGAMSCMKH